MKWWVYLANGNKKKQVTAIKYRESTKDKQLDKMEEGVGLGSIEEFDLIPAGTDKEAKALFRASLKKEGVR
jgi:hypothetical protein